jgi:hypothetical protein
VVKVKKDHSKARKTKCNAQNCCNTNIVEYLCCTTLYRWHSFKACMFCISKQFQQEKPIINIVNSASASHLLGIVICLVFSLTTLFQLRQLHSTEWEVHCQRPAGYNVQAVMTVLRFCPRLFLEGLKKTTT